MVADSSETHFLPHSILDLQYYDTFEKIKLPILTNHPAYMMKFEAYEDDFRLDKFDNDNNTKL